MWRKLRFGVARRTHGGYRIASAQVQPEKLLRSCEGHWTNRRGKTRALWGFHNCERVWGNWNSWRVDESAYVAFMSWQCRSRPRIFHVSRWCPFIFLEWSQSKHAEEIQRTWVRRATLHKCAVRRVLPKAIQMEPKLKPPKVAQLGALWRQLHTKLGPKEDNMGTLLLQNAQITTVVHFVAPWPGRTWPPPPDSSHPLLNYHASAPSVQGLDVTWVPGCCVEGCAGRTLSRSSLHDETDWKEYIYIYVCMYIYIYVINNIIYPPTI